MFTTFERRFVYFNRVVVATIIATMFILVFAQVAFRYLFRVSFPFIDEITGFGMIWSTYLGAGLALREGRLVAFDIVQNMFSPKLKMLLRLVIGLIMLVFMTLLCYWGIRFCQFGYNKETAILQISRAIPYAGIPVGAAFFSIHLALFFRKYLALSWDRLESIEGDHADVADKLMEE